MMKSLLLVVLVLFLGLGTGPNLLGQDKKDGKDKDKKEAKDKKDKPPIPQHLIQSVEQLIKAKDALKSSVQKEASEKHLEEKVLKELRQAIEDVEKGIKHAELAIKRDK